ncbi:MAG: hypothetical protein K8R02_04885 [Anaerohalosphaeraceae bacterium]|nr:hypothetical protein [Anaerohalosphaeraceae bacterium]
MSDSQQDFNREAKQNEKNEFFRDKIADYSQQLLSLCALQQAIVRNIQREISDI